MKILRFILELAVVFFCILGPYFAFCAVDAWASPRAGTASFYSVEDCASNPEPECPMASRVSLYEAEAAGYPFCASWDYPLGTWLRVKNVQNGRVTLCQVLDRGPAKRLYRKGRILDLSFLSFERLGGTVDQGIMKVEVEPVSSVRG